MKVSFHKDDSNIASNQDNSSYIELSENIK